MSKNGSVALKRDSHFLDKLSTMEQSLLLFMHFEKIEWTIFVENLIDLYSITFEITA